MVVVGRIKVNSIVKPMFLKVTDSLSEQFKVPVDEKNREFIGYTVLCRYDAPDGKIHIFASRGQWGNLKEIIREKMSEYIIVEKILNLIM